MLALILCDSPMDCSIIVVPPCIHNQWISEMKRYLPDHVKVSYIIQYSQVIEAMYNPSILISNRIILCTYAYWNTFKTAIDRYHVKRIIFDESHTEHEKENMLGEYIWYVSATTTANHNIRVTCDQSFIEESVKLPDMVSTVLRCKNNLARNVLRSVLSDREMNAVDAMDFSFITLSKGMINVQDEKEAVTCLRKDLQHVISSTTKYIETAVQQQDIARLQKQLKGAQEKLNRLLEKLKENDMCIVCLGNFEEDEIADKVILPCCSNSLCGDCVTATLNRKPLCPMCRADIVSHKLIYIRSSERRAETCTYEKNQEEQNAVVEINYPDMISRASGCDDKVELFNLLIDHFKTRRCSKVILFSDYSKTIDIGVRQFQKRGFECFRLDDEGTVNGMERVVRSFASCDRPSVLTIWSSLYGSGLNLEMATDIVFAHKPDPEMEKQVIGRAQRFGRTCPLNVWYTLNNDE
jgi:SNF2 family DNA or RNA helicase